MADGELNGAESHPYKDIGYTRGRHPSISFNQERLWSLEGHLEKGGYCVGRTVRPSKVSVPTISNSRQVLVKWFTTLFQCKLDGSGSRFSPI